MKTRWKRRGRREIAGLAAAAIGAAMVLVAPAAPAYAAACSTDAPGVTMVVDFASLGGGIRTSCAAADPATGVAALEAAGFAVTGTARWGLTFVCRISGKPGAATEPCVNTPPANAQWSYWHARPGGTWTYSEVGALSYNPAPGTVEGWAFGSGAPPGIAPPALVAPPAPPAPPAPKPPAPTPAKTTSRPGSGDGTGAGGPAATQTPPPPAPTSGATSPTSQAADLTTPATPGAPRTDPPTGIDATATGSSGPISTVVGIAIVLLLAAAAAGVAWRRRRPRPLPVDEPPTIARDPD